MAEQTGSIFFECDHGFFHSSNFSEILIRDKNFKLCKFKEKGIVQTISILPKSYPDIILLQKILELYMVKMIVNVEEWENILKLWEELKTLN